ncbi:hypothetical protein FA15DRAFT_745170 [Coprinopsis marcescibilis]|uniref:Uncharacterized protein n=1 Tax=Coprinopsis marcescibilis TaxID=230819 RepID=A0A5C3K8K9_COPMA|nr:hypothetical protein FA15DRAFT_745170 [Coprinopsis marcescibilis]
MIKRFVKLKKFVLQMISKYNDLAKYKLTNNEWKCLNDYISILQVSHAYAGISKLKDYLHDTKTVPAYALAMIINPNIKLTWFRKSLQQPHGCRADLTQLWHGSTVWLECGSGTASAAWLGGGCAAILKWKTANNFNWMIHVMLYYHTQIVQSKQERNMEEDNENEQEEEE